MHSKSVNAEWLQQPTLFRAVIPTLERIHFAFENCAFDFLRTYLVANSVSDIFWAWNVAREHWLYLSQKTVQREHVNMFCTPKSKYKTKDVEIFTVQLFSTKNFFASSNNASDFSECREHGLTEIDPMRCFSVFPGDFPVPAWTAFSHCFQYLACDYSDPECFEYLKV